MTEYMPLIHLSATVTAIGGAYMTVRKISKDSKSERKEHSAEILQAAKEEDAILKANLEAKIQSLNSDLKNLESNTLKDMEHIKEVYKGEIKSLSDKIESLREELRTQHTNIIGLLAKLVDKD